MWRGSSGGRGCSALPAPQHAVQAIWKAVRDLLQPSQPVEVRHTTLGFTQALVSGQYRELGMLRAHFFRVIQQHSVREDAQQR